METKYFAAGRGLLFDPIVIIRDVIRNWLTVVVLAAVISTAAYILADMHYTPVYESSATLVVTAHTSFSSVYDNIDSAESLTAVFSEVLNSSVMKKRILEVLEMSEFSGTISASGVEATNLLTLSVQASDPRAAFLTIQALIENHHIVTYDVIGDISLEVLQYPTVPKAPMNSSGAWRAMKYALVLATAGACAALAILSALRNTVRSRAEAEKKLKCWCLGEICHEKKSKSLRDMVQKRKTSILVTKPETSFEYVTALNKISRRIGKHIHGGNVLMVTSVAENEGKTTVSANLALSMCKKYRRVLLIDCDLRKPACHAILELGQPAHCINDVVLGKVSLHEAVTTDKLSGMHLLCAEKVASSSAESILSTEGMHKLIAQVRAEYDMVVIDLPPMSVCADSEYMAEFADASLLVVRQNVVALPELDHAVSVLENSRAKLLGCVVNDVHTSFFTAGGGAGRQYGRGGKYGQYDAFAPQAGR